MRIKIEDKKNCQKVLKIEIEPEKVKTVLDDIYKEISKDAQIAGFRKGKAPQDLIETHYESAAKDETMRKLIWDTYLEAVKSNNLEPLSYPVIEDVVFDKDNSLKFTVKIDTRPVVNLKSYTKIKVKKVSADVNEEDINKALEAVRGSVADFKIIEGRAIAKGDYVVCDYVYSQKDKPDEEKKNAWIYVDEKSDSFPIPKGLIGLNKSETKEFNDKNGTYKITIKEIKQKTLPELNDDLAKQVGNFKDIQELKERLRQELAEDKKRAQQANMENQLLNYLFDTHQFDVPDSVVQRQLDNLVNDAKVKLAYQGYKKEEIESQHDKLKEALAQNSARQVKIYFILDEIANKEKITVEEKELNDHIEKIAKNTKQDGVKLKEALEKQGLVDTLREQLLHDKVIEFLLKEANIT